MRSAAALAERDGSAPDSSEATDFPAMVVCARCGRADCGGCTPEKARTPSRDENVIPWEDPTVSAPRALWTTARRATIHGEELFATLGDGPILRVVPFAFVVEVFAIASFGLVWMPIMPWIAPSLTEVVVALPAPRIGLYVATALAGLATAMVVLHALWALGLEIGLVVRGMRPDVRRALRYALYSCGWDLLASPAGLAIGFVVTGRGALADVRAGVSIPGRATRVYLARARGAGEREAKTALRTAVAITGAVLLVAGSVLVVGALIVAVGL